MASEVVIEDDAGPLRVVAGFDAAYVGRAAFGGLVLCDADSGVELETVQVVRRVDVPYVPGFLSYREFPILESAWRKKKTHVDLLLVDGAGLMHPRHLGSASFAGLKLGVPSIGVTKNLFIGEVQGAVAAVDEAARVVDDGRLIGFALRTAPPPARPIYVSPGHRVSPERALATVRALMRGQRLPEPIRLAHLAAADAKQAWLNGGGHEPEAQGTEPIRSRSGGNRAGSRPGR